MESDGFVRQRAHEIGLPVPLQTRRIETVVHTLEGRIRNGADHVERWRLDAPNRFKYFLGLFDRPRITPHDAAHLLALQVLGERSRRRNGEKSKEAINVIRRLSDEAAIPAQYLRRVFHRPKHWAAIDRVHGLCLEQKRRHYAEVATSAAHRPEQVGIFLGAGGDEPSIGQDHFDSQQVVDGQAVTPRQVTDPATQSQSADARRRNDARRNGETEGVRRVVHVAPECAAANQHGLLFWVDANIVHRRQIDYQSVIAYSQTTRVFRSRANFTAVMTSATSVQRAIIRGRRSIIALYTLRAAS